MNWHALFEKQQQLDQYIQGKHGLQQENLIPRKILAFQVELGELANETRCFKFWSLKPAAEKDVILEEYVDGLHFLMSIGLEKGCVFDTLSPGEVVTDLCDQFQEVYGLTSRFEREVTEENYRRLFAGFLALGLRLELKEEEVMAAYWEKNSVNHQRQDQGY